MISILKKEEERIEGYKCYPYPTPRLEASYQQYYSVLNRKSDRRGLILRMDIVWVNPNPIFFI